MRVLCIMVVLVLSNIVLGLGRGPVPVPWEKQYNFQEFDFAADMCAAYGNGSVIVGGDWEDESYSDMRCRVTRVNYYGREKWTTWLDFDDRHPVYEGICRNEEDQTYVVVGTHDFNDRDKDLIFGEFDNNGNIVRTALFDNYRRGIDIIQVPGGYAALVLKYDPFNGTYPCVIKVDDEFNMIWSTVIWNYFIPNFEHFNTNMQPGNGLCLSLDGNSITVGVPYIASDQIEGFAMNRLSLGSGYFLNGNHRFAAWLIGLELNNSTPGYAALSNVVPRDYNTCIIVTTWDESLNINGYHMIYPPDYPSYIGVRAYEMERYSSDGYMITGMVEDPSHQWHMWIGITNNNFELLDSYFGSGDTGCFGEVNLVFDQMGGCVTEYGAFMAAGAQYLPTGHTQYNVMYQPNYGFDTGDASPVEPEALEVSTDGLSVYSNSELNHFNIQYHGEISGEPVANVYSICGRNVATLHGTRDAEGSVSFTFDTNSSEGCLLPSGVYIVTVNTGNSIEAATFTLLQ